MTTTLTAEYSNSRGGGTLDLILEGVSRLGEKEYWEGAKDGLRKLLSQPDLVEKVVKEIPWFGVHLYDNFIYGPLKDIFKGLAEKTPLDYIMRDKYKEIKKAGYAIVGFHGHLATRYAFSRFEKEFPNIFGVGYNYILSPEDVVENVVQLLGHISEKTDVNKYVFFTHSHGGVIAGEAALRMQDYVKLVCNIAVPNYGTPVAKISPVKGARVMWPGSSTLLNLRKHDMVHNIPVINIIGGDDLLVPVESAKGNGNSKPVMMDGCGHLKVFYKCIPALHDAIEQYVLQ